MFDPTCLTEEPEPGGISFRMLFEVEEAGHDASDDVAKRPIVSDATTDATDAQTVAAQPPLKDADLLAKLEKGVISPGSDNHAVPPGGGPPNYPAAHNTCEAIQDDLKIIASYLAGNCHSEFLYCIAALSISQILFAITDIPINLWTKLLNELCTGRSSQADYWNAVQALIAVLMTQLPGNRILPEIQRDPPGWAARRRQGFQ
jgi:hypothetical protein